MISIIFSKKARNEFKKSYRQQAKLLKDSFDEGRYIQQLEKSKLLELWEKQPEVNKKNFFYAKLCMLVILIPIAVISFFCWQIGVGISLLISVFFFLKFKKKNFKFSLIPLFCSVIGLVFGIIGKILFLVQVLKI